MSNLQPIDVSVIVTCRDQQAQLHQLLPLLFSQQYVGEFEVIVVDMLHDKDVEEWLEELRVHHPNLSHTFCPVSSRGIDINKLAFTLGAKAANYDWLVFLSAGIGTINNDFLTRLTANCDDSVDVLVGDERHKPRYRWPSFGIRYHKLSIYQPQSSFIVCRRSILLQEDPNIPEDRIIRLPL